MQKTKFIQQFLLLVTLLILTGCRSFGLSRSQEQQVSDNSAKQAENTDVSLSWFADSELEPIDIISASEAKAFVNNIYQTFDDEIFDPEFKQEERNRQRQELLAEIDGQPRWTRAELTEHVSNQFDSLSVSHLRILDPVEGEKLFRMIEQEPLPDTVPESAISAEMRGRVGILTVRSFLIPQVTKSALDQAKSQLSQAEVILIDVRGNGGGAGSSISYLVEDIVGADKVLWRDRTREGLQMQEPYVFQGYFDDSINAQSEAEIKLSEEQPYVEWRTRSEAKKDPRPHFILIDDQCGSSCDLFAGIIKDYGAATILGVRTMGALFGGDAFRLDWQGFALIVPTLQVTSPKGNTIEGVGVQPDVEIPECQNSGSQCLEKAVEIAGAAT